MNGPMSVPKATRARVELAALILTVSGTRSQPRAGDLLEFATAWN